MADVEAVELGRKIAHYRARKGLSQREFAPLISRSEAWLSQVERGLRKVSRLDVLERIAEVLDVPLAEFAPSAPMVAAEELPPEAIPLRLLLSANFALRAALAGRARANPARLAGDADRAWKLAHESRYAELVSLLETLLPRLEAAAVTERDPKPIFALLARSYHACAAALAKLQQFDAAWVAADRAIAHAGRAGDPLLMAEGAFRLALVFQGMAQLDQAEYTAVTAREAIEPLVVQGIPEASSVSGALALQQAMIAARTDRAVDARQRLDEARDLADQLGEGRNDYHTEFGPTNVRLHEVAVAIELGDAGTAIRLAESIDTTTLSAERRGRLSIDLARAWAQRRNVTQALAALEAAETVTSEQVRTHRLVHACVRDLLRIGQQPTPELIAFARRIGIEE